LLLWALKSWDYLGFKYFLKQISLKGDFNYFINNKVPIFYEWLLRKSTSKLRKILRICLRSFVNPHPDSRIFLMEKDTGYCYCIEPPSMSLRVFNLPHFSQIIFVTSSFTFSQLFTTAYDCLRLFKTRFHQLVYTMCKSSGIK